ncbi:hypothetical protein [Evansella clarkii]|uniref:hypothetical protein n=1 Tax=Evansella clarkii TaxID=79879 RepID=UPI000998A7CA|nr:hypothetical protein [Evansella clarkii]
MRILHVQREVMAKSMKVKPFFEYVMGCVETELGELGYDVMVFYNWPQPGERDISITLILGTQVINIGISRAEVERRKEYAPFALDWLIWSEIRMHGIKIQDSQYMQTLFQPERLKK